MSAPLVEFSTCNAGSSYDEAPPSIVEGGASCGIERMSPRPSYS
ncbi:MAG TPA: hypothetical protein VF705_07710 [Longimicrobium sp.]